MMQHIKNAWRSALFIWLCVATISVVWAPTAAAWFDNRFLPVVSEFEVTKVEILPAGVALSGRMYKPVYRESCKLREVVATINGEYQFQLFDTSDAGVFTRSSGWSSFTDWFVPGASIKHLKLTSRHSCHKFWDNVATIWDSQIPPVVEVTVFAPLPGQ